ncbi:MAG: zeta toxin family protein [Pseudomonadota bacterium]
MTTAPASRPRLLVVAGPNGAGKTTITERGLAHEWFHDCEYINPDAIAQDELGDWNDAVTVLHAAKLATERREACLNDRRSVAFETVFSAADKPEFVRRALALGYFVRIFFVGTERPEINAARVARRGASGRPRGSDSEDCRSLGPIDRERSLSGRRGGPLLRLR